MALSSLLNQAQGAINNALKSSDPLAALGALWNTTNDSKLRAMYHNAANSYRSSHGQVAGVDYNPVNGASLTVKSVSTVPTAATTVGATTIQLSTNDVPASDAGGSLPAGWVDTPAVSSNTFSTIVGVIMLLVLINFITLPFKMFRRR